MFAQELFSLGKQIIYKTSVSRSQIRSNTNILFGQMLKIGLSVLRKNMVGLETKTTANALVKPNHTLLPFIKLTF